jgi:hypothetical protein
MDQFEFYEQLQSHIGGIVRVCGDFHTLGNLGNFSGKIGLLVSAELAYVWPGEDPDAVGVELLIDGRVIKRTFYPGELEIIGADDAS